MNKKTVVIAISVFILLLVLGGVYFLYSKKSPVAQNVTNGSPFGNSTEGTTGRENVEVETGNNNTKSGFTSAQSEKILWKVSENPVSGATIIQNGSTTEIRYVEKATGHIYQTNTDGTSGRISNTTIPKTEEVIWGKDANQLLLRYESDEKIKTLYAQIASSSSATSTEVGLAVKKYLADNIDQVASSPTGDKIFYSFLFNNAGALSTANFNGSGSLNLSSSRFREWLVSWPNTSTLTITSKPSAVASGYMYFINTKTKDQRKVIGEKFGLTTLTDPLAQNVMYSQFDGETFSSTIFNVNTQVEKPLSPPTLAEKCAWGRKDSKIIYCAVPKTPPVSDYPDAWYQGRISFSDDIWRYDTVTGATELAVDLSNQAGEDIDAIEPVVSPNDDFLIFRNKRDFILWVLRLPQTPLEIGD